MRIDDFKHVHVKDALAIAFDNYEQERYHNEILPIVKELPDLSIFAEFNMGVAALDEEGRLIGYLCAYPPREDAFGTTDVKGTFVPIHAHGVKSDLPEKEIDMIYSKMYQAAAIKWVKEGILSHGIAIYAHNTTVKKNFLFNGFGIRCMDSIRPMEELLTKPTVLPKGDSIDYVELPREEWYKLLMLHNQLRSHLGQSPTFMKFDAITLEQLYEDAPEDVRYFAAKVEDDFVAYIKIGDEGENFVSELEGMKNIIGAFCCHEYRGMGVSHNLLAYVISVLMQEGYTLLGVDCESINPNAKYFWAKYFEEYTHSMVRRIDDKALL